MPKAEDLSITSSTEENERRHSRQGSRSSLPRRSVRSPLDINETPLTPQSRTQASFPNPPMHPSDSSTHLLHLPPSAPGSSLSALTHSTTPSFHTAHRTRTHSTSTLSHPTHSFPQLLRPESYHPLPTHFIPSAFLTSPSAPPANTPLSTLLYTSSYRQAAIVASTLLTSSSPAIAPTDHARIFALLYVRLACLTLCNQTTIAAQESKLLQDLDSSVYRVETADGEIGHVVPWNLRVLAVRLQAMGFGDVRRGVVGFYELGWEARGRLLRLKRKEAGLEDDGGGGKEVEEVRKEIATWEDRLEDLGIRIANALIEMGDLEGAASFLTVLNTGVKRLGYMKALLWLVIGDVGAARACVASASPLRSGDAARDSKGDDDANVIAALSHMADGSYDDAAIIWEALISDYADDETYEGKGPAALYKQNLAICNLYSGRGGNARQSLERLIDAGHRFHALTFNLCTLYELCSDKAGALKEDLAEKVAITWGQEGKERWGEVEMDRRREMDLVGWERVVGDFKL